MRRKLIRRALLKDLTLHVVLNGFVVVFAAFVVTLHAGAIVVGDDADVELLTGPRFGRGPRHAEGLGPARSEVARIGDGGDQGLAPCQRRDVGNAHTMSPAALNTAPGVRISGRP